MSEWINNWTQHEDIRKEYKETKDCMVVSFAEVWGADYPSAHHHMRTQFKRQHRRGVPYKITREKVIDLCPKTLIRKGPYSKGNRITIKKFCQSHPEGRYWVFVRGHALAVIDGVVYDHSHRPSRQITCAYRVYPVKFYPEKYRDSLK